LLTSASKNNLLYTSREFDFETGLQFNRMRYYSPNLGRFISKDKIYSKLLYSMAKNNPIRYVDPFGLSCTNLENCETCDPQRLRDCHEACLNCCDRHNSTRNDFLNIGGIVLGVAVGLATKNTWVAGAVTAGYAWLASSISSSAYDDCKAECDEYYTGNSPKACNQGVTTSPDQNCPKGQEHCEEQKY
jgi:RHS repeat-associated protein